MKRIKGKPWTKSELAKTSYKQKRLTSLISEEFLLMRKDKRKQILFRTQFQNITHKNIRSCLMSLINAEEKVILGAKNLLPTWPVRCSYHIVRQMECQLFHPPVLLVLGPCMASLKLTRVPAFHHAHLPYQPWALKKLETVYQGHHQCHPQPVSSPKRERQRIQRLRQ